MVNAPTSNTEYSRALTLRGPDLPGVMVTG